MTQRKEADTHQNRPPVPIAADDPRHGKLAGRIAGCTCQPCRAAKVAYEKRRKHDHAQGRLRRIDATGTHRRIRALMFMGWTQTELARRLGMKAAKNVNDLLMHDQILRTSAERIAALYDQLSMTRGPSARIAELARNRGYASPLAWDDSTINDPAAEPFGPDRQHAAGAERHLVDQVVVERALNGTRVRANPAERAEIARRWTRIGLPVLELDRIQGWNVHRDARLAKRKAAA